MKVKMKQAIHKIKNIDIKVAIAYTFYNIYLCRKVYFRYRIVLITDK